MNWFGKITFVSAFEQAVFLLQRCVLKVSVILRCLIGQTVIFVGPSA
jgi:hypothetical protein